jgi:hypothetical protein
MKKMNQHIWAALTAALLGTAVLFAACDALTGPQGEPGKDGINGTNGTDGGSAYEIAVKNGFEGTETAWLESLKGSNGTNGADGKSAYQFAVEQGFEGTIDAWIESLKGQNGTNGTDGGSAYDTAVKNGFEGTEAAWLESLKGSNGTNGKSAYEFAVEQGFEGDINAWLLSLKGAKGNDGQQGQPGNPGDKGEPGKPAAVMHPMWLGTFPVVLEDQTGQLTSQRTDWIQDALTAFDQSADGPDIDAVANLTGGANKNIRIIIEDADEYPDGKNYRVIDGRTCAMRIAFASTATKSKLGLTVMIGLLKVSQTPLE